MTIDKVERHIHKALASPDCGIITVTPITQDIRNMVTIGTVRGRKREGERGREGEREGGREERG